MTKLRHPKQNSFVNTFTNYITQGYTHRTHSSETIQFTLDINKNSCKPIIKMHLFYYFIYHNEGKTLFIFKNLFLSYTCRKFNFKDCTFPPRISLLGKRAKIIF